MKKVFGILLSLCMVFGLIVTVFTMPVSAAPVAADIRLISEDESVSVRPGSDLKTLCDGQKHLEYDGVANFDQKGIVLLFNKECQTPEVYDSCNLVIDLAETSTVDTVNITFYHYLNSMIGMPMDQIVTISYSDDGETFSELGDYTVEGVADVTTAGIFDEVISLGEIITCKSIMVSMKYGPTEWTPKCVLEWFGFTELSAGMAFDYADDGEDEESSEPEESHEVWTKAAPDYEAAGYVKLKSNPFFVSHFNNATVEGAGSVMTEEYTPMGWWLHVAFAPIEGSDGLFEVTEIIDGLTVDTASSIAIPEGGFVWAGNKGNNYTELGTGPIDYTNPHIDATLTLAAALTVGQVVCFENLDLEGAEVKDYNDVPYYNDAYVCTTNIITLQDKEDYESSIAAIPSEPEESSEAETPSQAEESQVSAAPAESSAADTSTASEASKAEESKPEETKQEGLGIWLWVIIGVAVVAIAVVVVIIIKKKKSF